MSSLTTEAVKGVIVKSQPRRLSDLYTLEVLRLSTLYENRSISHSYCLKIVTSRELGNEIRALVLILTFVYILTALLGFKHLKLN